MTVPSLATVDGQVPSAYIVLNICSELKFSRDPDILSVIRTALAVLRVAKLVPTTEIKPVPR